MGTIKAYGEWHLRALDRRGRTLWRDSIRNLATDEGLAALATDFFAAGTQKPNWYAGLISSSGYTGTAVSDTMVSHSGWSEFTSYVGASRLAWSPLTVSAGIIFNSSAMGFEFTASGTVKGFFIASDSTKTGTGGTLWSTSLFSAAKTMQAGQIISATYRVRFAGGT